MLRSRPRFIGIAAVLVASGALVLTGCSSPGSDADPSDTGTPVAGGEVVVGGYATTALDAGQLGYSTQSQPYTNAIMGNLFRPPLETGDDIRPGIASAFEYNSDNTELTITLRPGLKYSDDTPIDADSVVWNLERAAAEGMTSSQYFADVTDMKAEGDDKVVLSFGRPYTLLMDALAYTPAGYLGSPTAFDSMGADAYNQAPVGAGAFKIDSVEPGQQLVTVKNPNYWDAEHVYLDQVTWLKTPSDAQSALVQLQSGAIQSITFPNTTSPAVLKQAEDDTSLIEARTAATGYVILPINTFNAPFDNLKARQAIAYCMDRESIAKNVMQGYVEPAYVLAGDSDYLKDWQEGRDLNQYKHDVKKGTALVDEIGGLTFSLTTNVNSPVVTALQQQWAECGIDAKIDIRDDYLTLTQSGNYQMSFTTASQRTFNPAMTTAYQDPTTENGKYGFNDSEVTSLINKAKGLTVGDEARDTWHKIWERVNDLGVSIPVIGAPRFVFSSSCLQGVETYSNSSGVYDSAYLTC